MKRMYFGLLISVICLIVTTVEAKNKSEALEVVEAGGLRGLRDISQKELLKEAKKRGVSPTDLAIESVAVSTGVFSTTKGFSTGGEATFLAIMSMLTSSTRQDYPSLYAWMPESDAASKEVAASRMKQLLIDAYKKTLLNVEIQFETYVGPKYATGTELVTHYAIQTRSAECLLAWPDRGCRTWIDAIEPDHLPVLEKAPDSLGHYKAYAWVARRQLTTLSGFPFHVYKELGLAPDKQLVVIKGISENLPRWVYLYIPGGKQYVLSYPTVWNQGRPLLFVESSKDKD